MPAPLPDHCCHRSSSGQALLDILIAMGIFMILVHAIFSLTVVIYETMGYARTRLTARHIASEKMELLLNLSYTNLGTTMGIPHGIIPEFETINRNGNNYTVHTSITFVDDPYDSQVPTDLLPTDYKQIRVEVGWDGLYASRTNPIVLVSTIAPRGIETAAGGGTLATFVIDALANPVSGASVHIVNSSVTPKIDMTLQKNTDGRIILPGAPPCATCYAITVTKTGYTTDRTHTNAEVSNPNKRPVTVSVGQLSEATFVIDKTSKVTVTSHHNRSLAFSSYGNRTFRLTGTKTIGTDSDGDPVYKFDGTFTTNSNGSYTFNDMEWDNYILTIPTSEAEDISGISPQQPIAVIPGNDLTVTYALSAHTPNSLLLSIKDASGSAIASASAVLKFNPSFVATASSGLKDRPDMGQIFIPNLQEASYTFMITHPNYKTTTGTITVDGTTVDKVILPDK